MLATLDDGFFWLPGNPEAPLNRMKIKASGGKDLQECNDAPRMAWELNPGDLALANLEPAGMDVDYYLLWLKAPQKDDDGHGHDRAPRKPDHPLEVKLLLDRTEAGKMDLKITVTDSLHRVIKEGEARGRQEIRFEAPNYGTYYVKVEPLGTPSPWPPDTGYKFRYEVEE